MTHRLLAVSALALLAACSKGKTDGAAPAAATTAAPAAATAPPPAAAPGAAPAPVQAAGFDPAAAPTGREPSGTFPYFGVLEGATRFDPVTKPGDSTKDYLKDVAYDQYEIFDGAKLIKVEGRLRTIREDGKTVSFFQAKKSYEKMVHDLGGVTVFEGSGQQMEDLKLKFADGRHRGYFLRHDEMGAYMVKTPTKQVWVEVYQDWNHNDQNFWLTVIETKPLEVKTVPEAEMKSALDKAGHVALYINFDTDKTTIKGDSQPIIAEIVKLLTDNPSLNLTVEGHTDNIGGAPHNQTLSEGRANSVVGALMAQGIAMSRLQPKGFGATKPVADNAAEDGRAKNRRVELVKR